MNWKDFKEQGCLLMLAVFGGAVVLMIAVKLFFF